MAQLVIPDSVTTIGTAAFLSGGLQEVTLGKSLTFIGNRAFQSNALTSLAIPDSVITIGNSAFTKNTLSSLTLGSSVETIGSSAFSLNQLASLTIPTTVKRIGAAAFLQNRLTSVVINAQLTEIADKTFFYNQTLETVIIPDTVKTIGQSAFRDCGLSTVTLPRSLTTIGNFAFHGNQLSSLSIPNSVTTIGSNAFQENQLASITLGESVRTVSKFAFAYNSNLASLELGKSVTTFGENAFGYTSLTAVTIPNSVTTIGANAFQGSSMTSVTIGSSVRSIGAGAFQTAVSSLSVYMLGAPPAAISAASADSPSFVNRSGAVSVRYSPAQATSYSSPWQGYTTLKTVAVFFDSNGYGDTPATQEATGVAGLVATAPTPPSDAVHTFQGWYTQPVGGTKFNFTTPVTGIITLYAQWGAFTAPPTPTIVGSARVGTLLSLNAGSWTEPANLTYTWKSVSSKGVSSAIGTGSSYQVSPTDIGKKITVTVSATLDGFTPVIKTSTQTAAVTAGTFASPPVPTTLGTMQVGKTLTAIPGFWGNSAVLSCKWKRSGSTTVIGTDARYTIVAADSGKTLTVTVTGTAPGFTAATTTSVIGSAVISGAFSSGSSAAILGDKIAGSTLTAVTFGWVPATGVTFSYVWSRGFTEETQAPIALATKATYVLTDADKGQYISVRVTASKVGYTSVANTSEVIQIDS